MTQVDRYLLHAYVCPGGCVRWSHSDAWKTFDRIYIDRPGSCRYAVVEHGVPPEIIVWDLFATLRASGPDMILIPPVPSHVHTTIDAAVMATNLLYDEEDD